MLASEEAFWRGGEEWKGAASPGRLDESACILSVPIPRGGHSLCTIRTAERWCIYHWRGSSRAIAFAKRGGVQPSLAQDLAGAHLEIRADREGGIGQQ